MREEMNIVVVGHVDHGKSTLIGRLLYDTGSLLDGEIERVQKISKERGKRFEYAYLLDAFEEEQTQGITIDTTRIRFKSEKRDYVIIDAPGHKEFLKNMISGATAAEAALLLVDGNEGVKEQSRRHGYVLSLIGVKKVIVVVNKMDLVEYREDRFNEIKNEYMDFLNSIGINPVSFIPLSAFEGENLIKKSEKMPWYNGKHLIDEVDSLEKGLDGQFKSLRMPIQDVYKFDSRRIISGRIESGTINVSDEIVISPSNKVTRVKSLEVWPDTMNKKLKGISGESVGLILEDEYFFKRGEIISKLDGRPHIDNKFNCSIFWLGEKPLEKEHEYKLKLGTNEVLCEVYDITKVINSSSLENIKRDKINKNEIGEVIIKTKEDIAFDIFNEIEGTGRFVLVDGFDISGGGIISKLETDEKVQINRESIVTKEMREEKLCQKGRVLWLTGLPGCGKREMAQALEKELFDLGKNVYYLDYNRLNGIINDEDILDEQATLERTKKILDIVTAFRDSGMILIVTSINRFNISREFIKESLKENLLEINLVAEEKILIERSGGEINRGDLKMYYEKSDSPLLTLYVKEVLFDSRKFAKEIIKLI